MRFQSRVTRSGRKEVKSERRRRDGKQKGRTAAWATWASPETVQLPGRWTKHHTWGLFCRRGACVWAREAAPCTGISGGSGEGRSPWDRPEGGGWSLWGGDLNGKPVSGVAFKGKKEKKEAEGTHVSCDSVIIGGGGASKFAAQCSPIAE